MRHTTSLTSHEFIYRCEMLSKIFHPLKILCILVQRVGIEGKYGEL